MSKVTGYTQKKWKKRIMERSDITSHLTHLTRFSKNESSRINTLIKILNDKKLIGSDTSKGFIVGDNSAVCFQEAPLYGICQNVYHEQQNLHELGGKIRYDAIGLSFSKRYVYEQGGRPVLYDKKEVAKKLLPRDEWWRIVNFDLENDNKMIDWTHEREWRIKGDFNFEIEETYVLLLNQSYYKRFVNEVDAEILKRLKGIIVLQPVLE